MRENIIVTCEHGGNSIPDWLLSQISIPESILSSHRGWDIGALSVARELAPFAAAFFEMTVSRLCIELNRSPHHKDLFSQYSKKLSEPLKKRLIREIYQPYRDSVESTIQNWLRAGSSVVHLSIHSFTPVLEGEIRQADLGLLYDPKSEKEKAFCLQWKEMFKKHVSGLRVRLNYPYRGTADGLTTYLRRQFQAYSGRYAGIEVEINQGLFKSREDLPEIIKKTAGLLGSGGD